MTKEQYIEELRKRLSSLPETEREAALNYYIEYLEDAGDKTMEEIISELGTPKEVADKILEELLQGGKSSERKAEWENPKTSQPGQVPPKKKIGFWKILLIVLGVLLLLSVLTALAGGVLFTRSIIKTTDTTEKMEGITVITSNEQEPPSAADGKGVEQTENATEETLDASVPFSADGTKDRENDTEKTEYAVEAVSEAKYNTGTVLLKETNIQSIEAYNIASALVIRQGESWDLSYNLSRPENLQANIKIDDGEKVLEISYLLQAGEKPADDEKILLTVPAGIVLDSLEIENCLANISVAGLTLKELSLESSVAKAYLQDIKVSEEIDIEDMAGSVSMRNVEAAEFSAENNIGKIQGREMTVTQKLDVESSLGEVVLEGSFPCDMEFESNAGDVSIKVKGTAQEDYNYDLSDSIGKVEIGSLNSAGIGSSYQANNGKTATIKSEGNIGKLIIEFE